MGGTLKQRNLPVHTVVKTYKSTGNKMQQSRMSSCLPIHTKQELHDTTEQRNKGSGNQLNRRNRAQLNSEIRIRSSSEQE